MPSRPLSPATHRSHKAHSLLLAGAAAGATLLILVLLLCLFFSLRRRRRYSRATSLPLRRFRHRDLRLATNSFHHSGRLGRGSSAYVLRALLPPGPVPAAVKLFDPSPSSEIPFSNELRTLAAIPPSPFVVSLLGYCLQGRGRRRRRALVFEFMPNGSLQDALFGSSGASPALDWERRFRIILDVAKALAFLHLDCEPPVIHGDIKPSNVLLDSDFHAKISDFGLARFKTEAGDIAVDLFSQELAPSQELWKSQELASPEQDFAFSTPPPPPPPPPKKLHNNSSRFNGNRDEKGKETAAVVPCDEEYGNVDHRKELTPNLNSNGEWGKDWWWKQDGSGELSSRDYVQEWIGSQICPSTNPDWDDERRNSPETTCLDGTDETFFKPCEEKQQEKKDGANAADNNKKNKKVREWWKEEYFAEISNKRSKRRTGLRSMRWFRTHSCSGEPSTIGDGCMNKQRAFGVDLTMDVSFSKRWRRKRSQSVGSEMFSGDLFSRELSSTTSMRGTVCYVAPEYGGCGHLMEKADVYSFGVLVLVVIAGRRPLHVLSSPMKFDKANLVSWCRQLAQHGNVLELVDERIKDVYDKDQATLCIHLALLCLQRLPELRPDSGDIVRILKGEMDLPVVPVEFSPSPKFYSRSRRRTTSDKE